MNMKSGLSRRQFIKTSSIAMAGASAIREFPSVIARRAAPDDPIKVGVIGCGGRGTGAALNVLQASTHVIYPERGFHTEDVAEGAEIRVDNVEIVALADLFDDRLQACRAQLRRLEIDIEDDYCFTGFDAYKQLLAIDEVDYVILTEPPHFRPRHLMAAIEAGKHVFMEKPAAVDGPGVRMVIEAGRLAKQEGLGIAAGTQRRHDHPYVETIKRLQDGAIGEIHTGRAYWNGGTIWYIEREEGWTDMEWQARNWNYFTWLSGDHIVEQHVHNLDVINWILGEHPIRAHGMGGRQARFGEVYGHIYDHFAVEYEYASGARMFSQCRQMDGTASRVEEAVEGSNGSSNCRSMILGPDGRPTWRYEGEQTNPYEQEHVNLIQSILAGEPINEAQSMAESTLTGIMGRESAYSGQPVDWDDAMNSELDLSPENYEFGDLPFPEVAIPGRYRFV